MKLKATCTWGDGPDVLLVNEGKLYMLYDDPSIKDKAIHGYSLNGSICLTKEEAYKLANDLIMAAKNAEELEECANEYSNFFNKIE